MDKCTPDIIFNILTYAYDFNDPQTYPSIIWNFGLRSKGFYNITVKSRVFMDEFYYSMFPPVKIPSNARHVFDGDFKKECRITHGGRKAWISIYSQLRLNRNGYMITYYGSRSTFRCTNLDHYHPEDIVKRNKKTRFKDMYSRCRDKYINIMLKKYNKFEDFEMRNRNFTRYIEGLKRKYERGVKLGKRHKLLTDLKNDYDKKKKQKKKS